MASAFEEASQDRRRRGRGVYVRFVLAELAGLAMGAGIEWIAKLTTDASVRGRSLPDRLLTHPRGVPWEAHYAGAFLPDEVKQAQQQTDALVQRMVHAISDHDFLRARAFSEQERQARENLRTLRAKYQIDE
jgi:hypothetical protein